jgi:hypothetical protein
MLNRCLLLTVSVIAIFCHACDEKLADLSSQDAAAYYSLQVGKYMIYEVDSVIFFETIDDVYKHWQVKEEIVDTFYDLENLLNYRIERSRRPDASVPWQMLDVWSVRIKNANIERDENNLRFIKLADPVLHHKSWDGTAYLGDLAELPFERECDRLSFLEGWDYTYTSVDSGATIGGIFYDSIITVLQQGDDNLIELNYAIEVYAKGVGLVQKQFYHYTSQNTDDIPWEFKAECGYTYTMTLIERN